jgi:hypothetical protein
MNHAAQDAETREVGFMDELASLLNRYSKENGSDTPDFILAQYLSDCLAAWNRAVNERTEWYGRDAPVGPVPTAPPPLDFDGDVR